MKLYYLQEIFNCAFEWKEMEKSIFMLWLAYTFVICIIMFHVSTPWKISGSDKKSQLDQFLFALVNCLVKTETFYGKLLY